MAGGVAGSWSNRIHGGPDDLPGLAAARGDVRQTDLRLLLLNAVGPLFPEFAAGSTVPVAVIERAAA